MRYGAGYKEKARKRMVDALGRGFREKGYGIGVDRLAKEAGVTSGAFYGHFRSKAEAFRVVIADGLVGLRATIEGFRAKHRSGWIDAFANCYLGAAHRHDLADGCALPSLSAEVGRADAAARATYQAELLRVVDTLADGIAADDPRASRKAAWATLALLAGGVTLARAVHDEAVADEIAAAAREALRRVAPPDAWLPDPRCEAVEPGEGDVCRDAGAA